MPEDNTSPSDEDAQDQTSQELSDDVSDDSSSDEDTVDAETLKAELAAKDEENKKLQAKLRDKGRKLKEAETSTETPDYVTQEDLWERDNKDALEIYSDRIDEIMAEGVDGDTVSRKVALRMALAEARADGGNSTQRSRQDDSTVPSSQHRATEELVQLTEHDARVGLTLERKKELKAKYG